MTNAISALTLSQLSELISARMGLHFSESRWNDLERGIDSAAAELGFANTKAFIEWLTSAPLTKKHIEILASHLTVGETYFFREKESFGVVEERILPELIHSKQGEEKRLRIWSAGCSTGEEPYSIAILLNKMLGNLKDWNITILATDIRSLSLKKASEGIYTEWSFRTSPPWVKEGYFTATEDGRYKILPSIKRMVTFEYLNLAEDVYPSLLNNTNAMDLIFCRNVLMYFSANLAMNVVKGFYNSLVDNGWLIVSPAEASKFISSLFTTTNFTGTILYQKSKMGELAGQKRVEARSNEWEQKKIWESEIRITTPQVSPLPRDRASSLDSLTPPRSDSTKNRETKKQKETEQRQTPYEEALTMFEHGRYAETEEKLTALFLHDQGGSKSMALMARACANQGKLNDAFTWGEKAIAADTCNPRYHYLLATILQEQGYVDKAIQSLKKSLYLDHNFVLAYFVLGNLIQKQGESEASMKYLKNALELSSACEPEEVLPESEGVTAGRLVEIINSIIN